MWNVFGHGKYFRALLIGVGVGLVGGTYNLIRRWMAAFERYDEPHDEDEPPKP